MITWSCLCPVYLLSEYTVEKDIGIFFETERPPPLFISHCSSIGRSTKNHVIQQPSRKDSQKTGYSLGRQEKNHTRKSNKSQVVRNIKAASKQTHPNATNRNSRLKRGTQMFHF
ncbi:unnamed protein product [Acanthoscelides obtectus]|uniref:Uncharacterized protein n=1 Tax=Acanthoscelides obtectus TaxID=200917 RepID=A0A9P0PC99_ACAOB|nr:unnamed protein product [Acanthoscelides obtectus]CAK1620624.1 hypothetical protein AOBTE_LOCUS476 [Acanthoscelides obtectus]